VDKLFSKNEEFLFLIFKDNNTISLKRLINSKEKDYLNNNPNLIKWIIYQIAFGLYTLHSNNIIHHDIKPSNILIDEEGQILICDLGSSLFIGEDSYEYTLPYASPELLLENYKMNEKYDMWSLGVVILELYSKENNIFGEKI
jgi:serine/threonine protein kinase